VMNAAGFSPFRLFRPFFFATCVVAAIVAFIGAYLAPDGMRRIKQWDAEITDDQANQLIAWRSLPGADVDNSGVVRFERAPGGRGTVVRVEMQYAPPAGVVGATLAKLASEEPGQQVMDDLRRLKQVLETGEIARNDGPSARVADKVAARGKR